MRIERTGRIVRGLATAVLAVAGILAFAVPAVGEPVGTPVSPGGQTYTAIAAGAELEPEPEPSACAATGSASSGSLSTGLGSEWSTPVSSATFGLSCSGSAVLLDLGSLGAFVGS